MFETRKIEKKSDFIWAYRYAPSKIDDLILLDRLNPLFDKIIQTKHLPDTLMYGPAGTGKSSSCNVLIKEIDFDVLYLNGSIDNSIDNIRHDVKIFTTRSSDKPKLVYIEEFDEMSPQAQKGLRAEMELCQKSHFLFNCNYVEKVIEPIRSRCGGGISFFYNGEEKKELQKKYYQRSVKILESEDVKFEPKAVARIVQNRFPDMRNTIHDLQFIFNQYGEITLNAVESLSVNLDEFFELIKTKNFTKIRSYCANMHSDKVMFYNNIVGKIEQYIEPDSIGSVIDSCYDHMKVAAVSADQELALVHFCMTLFTAKLR